MMVMSPVQLISLAEQAHQFSNFGEAEQFLFQVPLHLTSMCYYPMC